uniref:Uncharacterized protein n=1 Tax=Anguilla anguilla TaxID=7936 RepID=A0A0E9VS11_ANGAN
MQSLGESIPTSCMMGSSSSPLAILSEPSVNYSEGQAYDVQTWGLKDC